MGMGMGMGGAITAVAATTTAGIAVVIVVITTGGIIIGSDLTPQTIGLRPGGPGGGCAFASDRLPPGGSMN